MKHRFFSQNRDTLRAVRYGMEWVNDSALEYTDIEPVPQIGGDTDGPTYAYVFDVWDRDADDNDSEPPLCHFVDTDLAEPNEQPAEAR